MKPKRQSPKSRGWIALGSILLLGCIAQCLAPAAGARIDCTCINLWRYMYMYTYGLRVALVEISTDL